MKNRQLAIITGASLIIMAIISAYVLGYGFAEIYPSENPDSFKANILSNSNLYRNMLIGMGGILFLDFLVSYTLYAYFKANSNKVALLMGVFRVMYTLIFSIATYQLTLNDATALSQEQIVSNFYRFQTIWYSGLIIFGFHVILLGYLMKWSMLIPKILWIITVVGGLSYILVHLLKLLLPKSETTALIEMFLVLPMTLAEMGLAVWLLAKGGKRRD